LATRVGCALKIIKPLISRLYTAYIVVRYDDAKTYENEVFPLVVGGDVTRFLSISGRPRVLSCALNDKSCQHA